jgi:putative redox protein
MIEISLRYAGDLHCEAVHGPSGATVETDAPTDNHGLGEAFSPTDLCATSLGTCMVTVLAIVAQKHGLDVKGTTLRVRKHMTAVPPRRIARVEIDFDLPLSPTLDQRTTLEEAAHTCPVALSLHPEVEKAVTFQWKE